MKQEIDNLIAKLRKSGFNRHSYEVTIGFSHFVENLLLHTHYDDKTNTLSTVRKDVIEFNKTWLERITPEFQRANNKWTKAMKLKFIENILSGAKTELLFFRFDEQDDAQIIDGLQRTTAIIDFFDGKIKPFGYSVDDLGEQLKIFRTNLTIKIYTFSNWEEVGKFYVDMNENITHSKRDIQKAKDYFLETHNITL